MKKLLQTLLACLYLFPATAQTAFTPGNLVVLQTSGTVSKAASAITLKEYTTVGVAGMSVSIPTTGPTPLQTSGIFGGSEGFLSTSTDGKYIALGGYASTISTADITATFSTSTLRAVGLVYPSGFYLQVDTSSTFFSQNDIRGAISDGTNFWASGASNANIDGIDYFAPGVDAPLGTGATPPKAYGLRIFNGQVYYSTQKAGPTNSTSQLGIFSLGSGLPTSGVVSVAQVINTGTAIPEDFSFDPTGTICYIAINVNSAVGGIQKWTKSGSVWSLAYTLGTGIVNTGAYGLVVDYSGANPIIYATTFDAAGNRVIKIVDIGAGAAATTLVAAVANVFYKGITFAPVASGNPLVNISVSQDTASEAAATVVTVTANASAPVSGVQTVNVAVSGTGITAGDYTLSNTVITIPAGATSGSVTFTVVNDILGEGTETANLTISSPSAGITLGMRSSQHIVIFDNDGNNIPTVKINTTNTTNYIDGGVSVSPSSPFKLSGVISDPTDPGSTLGINFTINDLETPATSLTVLATSSNTTVVPAINIGLTGTDSSRTLKITPAAVGYSNITLKVTDGIDTAYYVINYAASAASGTPAATYWHTGMSDGSDGIPQNDSFYVSGDDELDVLNVYSRTASGLPLKSFDYAAYLSLPDPGKPETDIEAACVSAAHPGRVYWMGSMSNGKDPFDYKPNRDRIFATTTAGTGAATVFTVLGWGALRSAILSWGDANGYGFTASAAAGVDSKQPNGFAAEGMVFGPDNTTLYVGFRAPLVPLPGRTKAVIAPVLNFETWFNNGAPSGTPSFGAPIELDLGGRGIRDMVRLSNGSFIILAGSPGGPPVTGAIYKWTGFAGDAPIRVIAPAVDTLNMEGAMQINTGGVLSLTSLQVVTDKGSDIIYNDGNEAKDFGDLIYRKFRSDIVTGIDLTYPEINVTGNGLTIKDGDITPSPADNTDFGNVFAGSSATKTFVIQNIGTASLGITGINFSGANSADFSFSGAPGFPFSITAGGTQSITVKFAPGAPGARNATLNIVNNDNDESNYDIALTGNGICYPIAVPSGNVPVCTGKTITLSDTGSGTWSTANAAIAAIGSGTGLVAGVSAGNTTITYMLPTNCYTTVQVTVNQTPPAISGMPTLCEGARSELSDATGGGTWSALPLTIVSASASGIITGIASGTAAVTYTMPNGCYTTRSVTVNALPASYAVTGGGSYCAGSPVALPVGLSGSAAGTTYQLLLGGSLVGAPVSATGTALSFGSYTAPGIYTVQAANNTSGCSRTMTGSASIVVNPLPAIEMITGGGAYCAGSPATAPHIWAGGSQVGVIYKLYMNDSLAATVAGTGTSLDFGGQLAAGPYTVMAQNGSTGCSANMSGSIGVVINPLPVISGNTPVCEGAGITLSSAPGGTWVSTNTSVATIGSATGMLTGMLRGTTTVTYTLPTGCATTAVITVNAQPAAITGVATVCEGATTVLMDGGGGTWSSAGVRTTVGAATGVVTGISAGTENITYAFSNGCKTTATATVLPSPAAITGPTSICVGNSMTLSGESGGIWKTTSSAMADIDSNTGVVNGIMAGTALIRYVIPNGCMATTVVTVNPLPGPIMGAAQVCESGIAMLADGGGGTWFSGNTAVADIGSNSGIISGIAPGIAPITYTLPTGCITGVIVTVNPLPGAITGITTICAAATTTLVNTGGGVWSSGSPAIAVAGSSSGIITGIAGGTACITYTLPTGCIATKTITVNALPLPYHLTGGGSYCAGGTGKHIGIASSQGGISYQLYNGIVARGAAVTGTGSAIDFGRMTAAGIYMVIGRNTATTCSNNMLDSAKIIITPLSVPGVTIATTPGNTVCAGTPVAFTAAAFNGGSSPLYRWMVNGVVSGTGSSFGYTPADHDIVKVKLTSNAVCAIPDSAIDVALMQVNSLLMPVVTVTDHHGPVTLTSADTLIATVTNGGTPPSYQWVKNGSFIAGATTSTYIGHFQDRDSVACAVISGDPCGGFMGEASVIINHRSLNVADIADGNIVVVPNPGKGIFTVKGTLGITADTEVSLELTDMLGHVIYAQRVNARGGELNERIDMSNTLASGTYLLNLRSQAASKVFHIVVVR